MAKNRKIKNINDIGLKTLKRLAREEEIALFGKQISFRTVIYKNKKKYDRKKMKKNTFCS